MPCLRADRWMSTRHYRNTKTADPATVVLGAPSPDPHDMTGTRAASPGCRRDRHFDVSGSVVPDRWASRNILPTQWRSQDSAGDAYAALTVLELGAGRYDAALRAGRIVELHPGGDLAAPEPWFASVRPAATEQGAEASPARRPSDSRPRSRSDRHRAPGRRRPGEDRSRSVPASGARQSGRQPGPSSQPTGRVLGSRAPPVVPEDGGGLCSGRGSRGRRRRSRPVSVARGRPGPRLHPVPGRAVVHSVAR